MILIIYIIQDTSPLHCMLKEKYKEEVKEDLDYGSYPESRRRSDCRQTHVDHTIYYKSNTWDGDLEKEIVRMFEWSYSEINGIYSEKPGTLAWNCHSYGKYASVSARLRFKFDSNPLAKPCRLRL